MRTAVILVAVVVVCSLSTIEAHAQSGYALSVWSPTNGQNYGNGAWMNVNGSFTYPWPCVGITCSPNVWLTLTGGNTMWYNVDLNANGMVSYGYGYGGIVATLTVYANMPWGSYDMDIWLSDATSNPPAGNGNNVLGSPVFLTISVGP